MRIVEIREKTVPIASPIANAYTDFSRMTCSVVAVITDVVRDGRKVVGYGFSSNGRYGLQGAEDARRARIVTYLIANGIATIAVARRDEALEWPVCLRISD